MGGSYEISSHPFPQSGPPLLSSPPPPAPGDPWSPVRSHCQRINNLPKEGPQLGNKCSAHLRWILHIQMTVVLFVTQSICINCSSVAVIKYYGLSIALHPLLPVCGYNVTSQVPAPTSRNTLCQLQFCDG